MKAKGTCRGCGRRRLINTLGLCKRCNKTPTKFLSRKEIARVQAEAEAAAAAAAEARAAEAAEQAAHEEEPAPEGEAPASEEESPEPPQD